jgi:hypothetical protein
LALKVYIPKYDTARKVLDDAALTVETARAAAPLVEAAKDKTTRAQTWIAKLISVGVDIATSLSTLGIKTGVK